MFAARTMASLAAVVMLTAGCATPLAVQVATVAADGLSVLATGKGTSDHALSGLVGKDCRLSNLVKDAPVCRPHREAGDALIAARADGAAETVSAFADGVDPLVVASAASVAPAAGIVVQFSESAGMNVAELIGAPADTALVGRIDGEGTLAVFVADGSGNAASRPLFVVPGYARSPGTFTGVVVGSRFLPPESIVR